VTGEGLSMWGICEPKRPGVSPRHAGIGYNCVLTINIRRAKSRLRGNVQALYIVAKYQGSRFEFVFTSLIKNSPRLFTTVQAVLK
jgi:Bardet-Biedl syndrome 5 protein